MNDMTKGADQAPGTMGRRDLLKKGAAAGAIVWTTPMILSETALAAGGGTPECRPVITVQCERYNCQQGQKYMPGVRITVTPCQCSDAIPPETPDVCVRVVPPALPGTLATCGSTTIYRSPTTCAPLKTGETDYFFLPNAWECVPQSVGSSFFVFFGQLRNANGSIEEIPDGCKFTFRLDVWAGGCPTESAPGDAYSCESYNVVLWWDNGASGDTPVGGDVVCYPTTDCPDCGLNPSPGDPGCVGVTTSPCGTC